MYYLRLLGERGRCLNPGGKAVLSEFYYHSETSLESYLSSLFPCLSLLHTLSSAIATAAWLLPQVSPETLAYKNKFGYIITMLKNLDPMFFFILFSHTIYSRHTKLLPISEHFKLFITPFLYARCFLCLLLFLSIHPSCCFFTTLHKRFLSAPIFILKPLI